MNDSTPYFFCVSHGRLRQGGVPIRQTYSPRRFTKLSFEFRPAAQPLDFGCGFEVRVHLQSERESEERRARGKVSRTLSSLEQGKKEKR